MFLNKIKWLFIFIIVIFIIVINLNPEIKTQIKFIRPVPEKVKLIQKFGLNILSNDKCYISSVYRYAPSPDINLESIFILGMSEGVVIYAWIDKPLGFMPNKWKKIFSKEDIEGEKQKRDGGIIIDYGIHDFGNDAQGRLLVKISNIIPLVHKKERINIYTKIAKFASKKRFGYDPTVSIEFALIDKKKGKLKSYLALLPNE